MLLKVSLATIAIASAVALVTLFVRDAQPVQRRPASDGRDFPTATSVEVKATLEREKLELEVRSLKWNWVSGALPIALGLATLFVAWFSGLFEVRTQRLELQRDILARDVRDFEERRATVLAEVDTLRQDLESLKSENQKLGQANADVRTALARAPIEILVTEIRAEPDVRTEFIDALVARIREGGSVAVEALQQIMGDGGGRIPALLAYSLVLAFPTEPAHLDKRFAVLAIEVGRDSPDLDTLATIGDYRWPAPLRRQVAERALALSRLTNPSAAVWIYSEVSRLQARFPFSSQDAFRLHRASPDVFCQVLANSIQVFVNRSREQADRETALRATLLLSPAAALAAIGASITTDPGGEADFLRLKRTLKEVVGEANKIVGGSVRGPLPSEGQDYYAGFEDQWLAWRNQNAQLVELWLDPELRQVRSRPELVEAHFKSAYDR